MTETASATSGSACFHCALPIPAGVELHATIGGTRRAMCCPGCVAVAEIIAASGLDAYYRFRERPAGTPEEPTPARAAELARYDHPALQRTFVRVAADGLRRCTLSVDGIRCGACVWLIEEALRRRPGVRDVAVNAASARAEIAWDAEATRLGAILGELARLGYTARPYRPDWEEDARAVEFRAALWRLGLAGLGAMQVMMYAVALYAGALEGMADVYRDLLRWVSGIVAAPVVVIAGGPFFANAWRDLRQGRIGMDGPVALAIGLTFAASLAASRLGGGEVYFESVCMFVFLLTLGRFIEMRTRHRAATTIERALRRPPACATRLTAAGGEELVGVYELAAGDRVLVKPGESVPADGRVIDGAGWVDEAMLTGEHWPRAKRPGERVTGGTQNGESPLTVEIERVGADTTLAAVVRLVDVAGRARPRLARVADRVAKVFVPRVAIVAGLAALAWLCVEPARAPWIALAVLVVSCPCALSLATPVALTAASGTLVRTGLLATREHVLEGLGKTTHVVFDKTGTLTKGRVHLVRAIPIGTTAGVDACLAIARALEAGSSHPIAAAFARGPLPARGSRPRLEHAAAVAGHGVEAVVDGVPHRLGMPEWAASIVNPPAGRERRCAHPRWAPGTEATPPADGGSWVLLAAMDGPRCWFELDDELRTEAPAAVAALGALGIEVQIVSGDAAPVVARLARRLGVATAVGRATPESKLEHVRRLQDAGAAVLMVGDGVNDAPGLGGAAVAIAMGGGTDLARTHADAVLLREDLRAIPAAVRLARRTRRVIGENLAWAIGYNAVAVPLAALGLVPPYWAAIGMSASSLVVVANAWKLARTPCEVTP